MTLPVFWNILALSLALAPASLACNHFSTMAGDGTVVTGRDMQFAAPESGFPFRFRTHPKGVTFHSPTDNGCIGAKWTIKYGYLTADGGYIDVGGEGLNTEGLQCSALYFPNYASFMNYTEEKKNVAVGQLYLCDWILGNHARVSDVNETLPDMVVVGLKVPSLGMVPLHYVVTDKTGESIVIEYTKGGKLNIWKNSVGVLTNSPPYDWHMTNLGTYAPTMFPLNPEPVNYGGYNFGPSGNWGSMVGLPGNMQGSARFVHHAVLLYFAQDKKLIPTADKAVNLIAHMLNVGDIVNGTLVVTPSRNKEGELVFKYEGDSSLFQIIYDLNQQHVYMRSYNNQVWQFIDMNALDFKEGAHEVVYPIYNDLQAPNVTSRFKPLKL